MNEISPSVAFWIFDAWREMNSQLHLSAIKEGVKQGSPVSTVRTDPNASIISVVIVDTAGQKREWIIPVSEAVLSFGVVPEATPFPEFAEGVWRSFLSISFPDGRAIVFGERYKG